MANKVTIQDIADALGISRNTVSKAINNTGILADSTREKILKKAAEMGYKQFSYLSAADIDQPKLFSTLPLKASEIALFTTIFWGKSYFICTIVDTFQKELARFGYTLTMHRILEDEIEGLKLPHSFNREKTAGIICFELFDHDYGQMVCSLGFPVLFVDSPVSCISSPLNADRLLPDNQSGICAFIAEMARRNKKQIGFVGEYLHCQSFFERYMGYQAAMLLSGLSPMREYCILGNKQGVKNPDSTEYQEYLTEQLNTMSRLPQVFICANDFVAIDFLQVLKKMKLSVPEDLYLCGFDDASESRMVTPPLTTIHIHSKTMGICAANLLISRIKQPSLHYRTVHVETSLLYRESTADTPD